MKTLILSILLLSSAFAGSDSLLNAKLYSGTPNQVRIHLGKNCQPCALNWVNDNGVNKVVNASFYGLANDTVKIQYTFTGGASYYNKLQIIEADTLRTEIPFTMDYAIPEAIPNKKRQIVQVQLHKTRYLVSGRPWARGGWMVGR